MPQKDFAWLEGELSRRLVAKQKTNPSLDIEHVLRDLDVATYGNLSDEALAFAIERFARYGREPWHTARAQMIAEQAKRQRKQNRFANVMILSTLVVAAIGTLATIASMLL